MISDLTTCTVPVFLNSATVKLKLFCNNSSELGTDVTFEYLCNIPACGVKYNGICISELAFTRGTLFDPAFGGLSGRYPTDQGIIPFEARGSPQE
jgi:hypothetical protein